MTTMTPAAATELFRKPPTHHIDVGAGEVAYRRVGSGPDVLFVHGWPAHGATFRGLLPHLTPHVTCHVLDLVGAGHSRFDRTTPISLDRHIESVRKVVDALDLDDVAVVGHDSGGMIARHALAGDERVRAMAFVDTELPPSVNWRFKQFLWMSALPGFGPMLAWAANHRLLRRNRFLLGDCFADRAVLDGEFSEFFLVPLRDDPLRQWAAVKLIRSFDLRRVAQLSGLHAQIRVPVKLVWGTDDPFFPVEVARRAVDSFANATLTEVPRGKLFVHEEFPEAVAKAMLPTLLGQPQGV